MTVENKTVNCICLGVWITSNAGHFRGNSVHEEVPYHTEVHWLSQGKVLWIFYDSALRSLVSWKANKWLSHFEDEELEDEKWLSDLAFWMWHNREYLTDIEYLNILNVKLQFRKQMITEMQDLIRRFKLNCLCGRARCAKATCLTFLFASQSVTQSTSHSWLKCMHTESGIQQEIADFETQKFKLDLFANPFAGYVYTAPEQLHLELIEYSSKKTQYQSFWGSWVCTSTP